MPRTMPRTMSRTLSRSRFGLLIAFAMLWFFPGLVGAQTYTSIVVFGDSLSDTGNAAAQSKAKYTINGQVPGPATGYTDGRFTDGTDTVPAAHNYNGVWVEQLAALLTTHPAVTNSLAGGTDYAYGFATTASGSTVFTYGPGNSLSFVIDNMGQQVTNYLATNPTITNKTLFVVWGGANDLLAAVTSTNPQATISAAVAQEATLVQRLIAAGATDIIVPNLPPLGLIPRNNGSPAFAAAANQASAAFDQGLAASLGSLPGLNPGKTLHIYQLDVYALLKTVVGPPIGGGFVNVTASSQFNSTVNPDTYLFWDDLHPTTAGHQLIALSALTLLGSPVNTTTTLTSSSLSSNLGSSITFTASVAGATGTPVGSVTFLDGATVIGTGTLTASATTSTATFTTTALTAGTHSITATYTGVNGYVSSTSAAISQIVTAPLLAAAFVPSSINVTYGGSGTATLVLSPVGGFTGTATFACATLPVHFSCTFAPTSLSLTGNNQQQSTTLTVNVAATMGSLIPHSLGMPKGPEIFAALTMFPCLGFVGFAAFKKRKLLGQNVGLMVLWVVVSAGAVVGLSGCGGNSNAAPKGSYTVPVTVTANGSTSTASLTVVVQ